MDSLYWVQKITGKSIFREDITMDRIDKFFFSKKRGLEKENKPGNPGNLKSRRHKKELLLVYDHRQRWTLMIKRRRFNFWCQEKKQKKRAFSSPRDGLQRDP